jgi:hypothetical protein
MAEATDNPTLLRTPWHEALQRADSFEALRAELVAGRLLARHRGLHFWPFHERITPFGVGGKIPRDWWPNARLDEGTGYVIFKLEVGFGFTREVLALFVELEAGDAGEQVVAEAPRQGAPEEQKKPLTVRQSMMQAILERLYPPDGKVPDYVSAPTVKLQIDAGWDAALAEHKIDKKLPPPDRSTVASFLGRRKS